MNTNSITDMRIEKFDNDIKRFIEASMEFSKKNVKVNGCVSNPQTKSFLNKKFSEQFQNATDYLQVDLSMEIPKKILMSLCSIIHDFVSICETHDFHMAFSDEESGFISGMKCIDNILKHNKIDFNITDLIYPDFKVETLNDTVNLHEDGSISIPLEQIDFRLGAIWVEINEEIINAMQNKSHFPNYSKYLNGFDVIDTVIEAKKIIGSHTTE